MLKYVPHMFCIEIFGFGNLDGCIFPSACMYVFEYSSPLMVEGVIYLYPTYVVCKNVDLVDVYVFVNLVSAMCMYDN